MYYHLHQVSVGDPAPHTTLAVFNRVLSSAAKKYGFRYSPISPAANPPHGDKIGYETANLIFSRIEKVLGVDLPEKFGFLDGGIHNGVHLVGNKGLQDVMNLLDKRVKEKPAPMIPVVPEKPAPMIPVVPAFVPPSPGSMPRDIPVHVVETPKIPAPAQAGTVDRISRWMPWIMGGLLTVSFLPFLGGNRR